MAGRALKPGSHTTRLLGEKELTAALVRIQDDLAHDLAPAGRQAMAIVLPIARAEAPKLSGRLAGSLTVTATSLLSGEPYAAPIVWGWPARGIEANPFPQRAIRIAEGVILDIYTDRVQHIIDRDIRAAGADDPTPEH